MADRVCLACQAPLRPVDVVDDPAGSGSVTFKCGECGAEHQDNDERTSLALTKR